MDYTRSAGAKQGRPRQIVKIRSVLTCETTRRGVPLLRSQPWLGASFDVPGAERVEALPLVAIQRSSPRSVVPGAQRTDGSFAVRSVKRILAEVMTTRRQ